MNRLIKFRVWDIKQKKFLTASDFGILGNGKLILTLFGYYVVFTNTDQDDYVIQQYTGLTDINGKEIYEGDIVKDTWRESHPYSYCPDEEYNNDQIFEVKYKDYSFNLDKKYSREKTHIEGFRREVISNIFEHSEILK